MNGGCSVDVPDGASWDDIEQKAMALQFTEFLPAGMNYGEEQWDFDLLGDELIEDDSLEEAVNDDD